MLRQRWIVATGILLTVLAMPVFGQEESDAGEADEAELAKAAQNPIGSLISVPFQNNMNFDVGPADRTQNILNIQPVLPFGIAKNWNLITRTILPVISQPAPGDERTNGLGDLNSTGWISPKAPGKVIWGVGPSLIFPTATDDVLGSDKWSAGPSVVVLTMPGPWVIGGLASNVWSYAGDEDAADVNSFLAQYFINYNYPSGWYLTSAPIITANWEADSGEKWTIPFGGGIGQVFRIGMLPIHLNVQAYYNVKRPKFGGRWQVGVQWAFLFPKG